MFLAGTYVTGMSSASAAAWWCLGTATSDVSADPPKTLRSMSTTTCSATPSELATRVADSNSTTCRCP